jgi:antitoxin component YwqK of YwqJK toxin-antitoxin module
MKLILLWLGVTIFLSAMAENVWSHGVLGKISSGEGLMVEAEYDDGEPMSYASIEIFDSEEKIPFQSGRTDRNGRFLFYPDKMGDWKVVVNDGMGHRLALKTNTDKTLNLNKTEQQAESIKQNSPSRYERALMGISIIFGIFGTILGWRGYNRRNFLLFLVLSGIFFLSLPGTSSAKENIVRQDSDNDGKIDRIAHFDQAGKISKLEEDSNRDGTYDIMSRYKDKKPICQEKDTNFDGKKDFFCHFDAKGFPEKIEEDTRYTGRIDRIRIYRKGVPDRVEYDADGDGFMETISFYKEGKIFLQTQDKNKDGKPDVKIFFNQKEEKERVEKDEDGDGKVDLKVFYKNGRLTKSEEDAGNTGHFNIVWFYNDSEEAVRAEEDNNGDGRMDTWYFYQKNRLTAVKEDTNGDGKPDIWEEYDDDEVLIKRKRDLDFDGKPDVEDMASGKVKK